MGAPKESPPTQSPTETCGALEEMYEGDGTAGVGFALSDGGVVFVTRWTDRGQPREATPADWQMATFLRECVEQEVARWKKAAERLGKL